MGFILFTILIVVFTAALFFAWFTIHRSKEKERHLLIEKGIDPSELPERSTISFRFPWLKLGALITSIAVGMIIGIFLMEAFDMHDEVVFVGMFLFGGVGLIVAHYVDKPE